MKKVRYYASEIMKINPINQNEMIIGNNYW